MNEGLGLTVPQEGAHCICNLFRAGERWDMPAAFQHLEVGVRERRCQSFARFGRYDFVEGSMKYKYGLRDPSQFAGDVS